MKIMFYKCVQSYSKSLLNQNISQNYVFDTNTNTNINNNMKIIMLYIIRSKQKMKHVMRKYVNSCVIYYYEPKIYNNMTRITRKSEN